MGRKRAKVNTTNYQASRVQQGWSDVKYFGETHLGLQCVSSLQTLFSCSALDQIDPSQVKRSQKLLLPQNMFTSLKMIFD